MATFSYEDLEKLKQKFMEPVKEFSEYVDIKLVLEAQRQLAEEKQEQRTTDQPGQASDSTEGRVTLNEQELLKFAKKLSQQEEDMKPLKHRIEVLKLKIRNKRADLEHTRASLASALHAKLGSEVELEKLQMKSAEKETALRNFCISDIAKKVANNVGNPICCQQQSGNRIDKDERIIDLESRISCMERDVESADERCKSRLEVAHRKEMEKQIQAAVRETRKECMRNTKPLVTLGFHVAFRNLEQQKRRQHQDQNVIDLGNAAAHRGSAVAHALMYQPFFSKQLHDFESEQLESERFEIERFDVSYGFRPNFVWNNQDVSWLVRLANWHFDMKMFHRASFHKTDFYRWFKQLKTLIAPYEEAPVGVHVLGEQADKL
ncbi:hypothetical protein DL98DRAFT_589942 [Cadophora sp. DSE1049]|nr:hypothetical protein DL98DRAFT_589942 [Cadophora sp. DSE1049]